MSLGEQNLVDAFVGGVDHWRWWWSVVVLVPHFHLHLQHYVYGGGYCY